MPDELKSVAVGDSVVRQLGADGPEMILKVTAVIADRIICGPWEFDRRTGGEIDDDLGWDGVRTGSVIRLPEGSAS